MMNVVYPLGTGSKAHDDFELRYSLRSLMAQPWVKDVCVIGHKPNWYTGRHVACLDPYPNNKDANIINKILLICNADFITEDFVINSDDQILLEAIDEEWLRVPPAEGRVNQNDYKMRAKGNNWHARVMNTVHWAARNKHPDHIYDSHRPYIVNKKEYVSAMAQIPWGFGSYFTTHSYFNIMDTTPGKNCGSTVRIKTGTTFQNIQKFVSGATFLNFNDAGLNHDMKRFLQDRFPEPSRWEE